MAKSQRSKQKKQVAKNAKRKQKLKQARVVRHQNGQLAAIKRCVRGTIHECHISDKILDDGFGTIFFSRHSMGEPGQIGFAVILVDSYCLGLKDCYFRVGSEVMFRNYLEKSASIEPMRPGRPEKALKIIEGAIDFAHHAGFPPHRDFKSIRLLFGDVDASLYEEPLGFGREGKPFYIQGPSESPTRISQIIKTLQTRFGDDGFNFLLKGDFHPDG